MSTMTTPVQELTRARRGRHRLIGGIAIVIGALFLPWGYLFQGFIPADAYESQACMDFVAEHEMKGRDDKLELGPTWHKHGKAVIEIRAFSKEEAEKTLGTRMFNSILCVYGDNAVYTLHNFERSLWQR